MRPSPARVLGLAAATLALLSTAACGGSSPSSAPSADGSAPSVSASASSTGMEPTASTEPSATESSATPEGTSQDACKALTSSEASSILGVKVTKATSSTLAGSSTCAYTTADMLNDPSLTTQILPTTAGIDALVAQVETQFQDSKTSTITVAGADDARLITGTLGGAPGVDVLAVKGGIAYQVLIGQADGKASKLSEIATKGMEKMLA